MAEGKKSKIRGRELREEVLKKGRTIRGSFLSVKYIITNSAARIAVIISSKTCSSAVKRHRTKRVIEEWFRKNKNDIFGKDVAVILQKVPEDMLLTAELDSIIKRFSEWKENYS